MAKLFRNRNGAVTMEVTNNRYCVLCIEHNTRYQASFNSYKEANTLFRLFVNDLTCS